MWPNVTHLLKFKTLQPTTAFDVADLQTLKKVLEYHLVRGVGGGDFFSSTTVIFLMSYCQIIWINLTYLSLIISYANMSASCYFLSGDIPEYIASIAIFVVIFRPFNSQHLHCSENEYDLMFNYYLLLIIITADCAECMGRMSGEAWLSLPATL